MDVTLRVVRKSRPLATSARVRTVCAAFGVDRREADCIIADNLRLQLRPGTIVLITGPSGSGKSSVLRAIAARCPDAVWVDRSAADSSAAIIDLVAPARQVSEAMAILTACGLGEPRLWMRRITELSDGEQFRAALARAIGEAASRDDQPIL